MRTACDELEADLQDLGLWLGDLWTGKLTVRRVAVIASQLKPGARVWAVGSTDAMWSNTDYWLSVLVDDVRDNTWVTQNRGVKKPSKRPDPVKRPKDLREQAEREAKLVINARTFQQAWRRRQQQESANGD